LDNLIIFRILGNLSVG